MIDVLISQIFAHGAEEKFLAKINSIRENMAELSGVLSLVNSGYVAACLGNEIKIYGQLLYHVYTTKVIHCLRSFKFIS